jgi:hypothetical protein
MDWLRQFFQKPDSPLPAPLGAPTAGMPPPGGVGVVYDSTGKPKISEDFLRHLPRRELKKVEANLASNGWLLRGNKLRKVR